MAWFTELVPVREQAIDEPFNPPVPIQAEVSAMISLQQAVLRGTMVVRVQPK
jgi:hypothetical protein